MNYFRCTVGGSGKGNTVTVTCAEEFAGLTITLSKTGKTYTKTCPSTAPYEVTFYGVEVGTYTVSCTVDGETYSETVVVQDISCVLNYGFNWKIWVDTASQLDLSDYDSLDEVLADEKALRELFLEHACVDYMAELTSSNEDLETVINNDLCAKWINLSDYALDFLHANEVIADLMDEADKYGYGEWALMPQVPKMTSNTAPFGVASASSEIGTDYMAWKAFDGTASVTRWLSTGGVSNATLAYQFVTPTVITGVSIVEYAPNGDQAAHTHVETTIYIEGSNDGTSWSDSLGSLFLTNENRYKLQSIKLNNTTAYTYYRIRLSGPNIFVDNTYYCGLCSVQFNKWAPKGNVPVMTSNTAPYGTVSSSNSTNAINVFDQNESTTWVGTSNGTNQYVTYKFTNPVCVKKARLYLGLTYATSRPDRTFYVRASNDGTNYVNIGSCSVSGTGAVDNIIDCSTNEQYYLYYQVFCADIINVTNSWAWSIATLQFYGRELKVSVPKMTSNTAPYGQAFQYKGNFQSEDAAQTYKAFDGDSSTNNNMINTQSAYYVDPSNSYVGYKFIHPIRLKMALINKVNWAKQSVTNNIVLEASNDGQTWEAISNEIAFAHMVSNNTPFTITSDSTYTYFRARPTTSNTAYQYAIDIFQLYGEDYSEKEFESGATKKWLYDHGVELEDMTIDVDNGATITKRSNDIYMSKAAASSIDGIYTTSKIDFTPYSLVRVKIGDEVIYSSNNRSTTLEIMANAPHVYGGTSALAALDIYTTNAPNNYGLSVSSINQSAQPEISIIDATKCTIKEWWLE